MLRSIMLTLAMLASAGVHAGAKDEAAQGEAVLTLRVDGELSIDPEGKVADYRIRTKLDPQLERLVRRAVPSWRFKPILVDGKPVIASSPMRITLSAEEMDQGYKVVVDNPRKIGVSDLTGNEILAGVSPFALSDTSVIGKTL